MAKATFGTGGMLDQCVGTGGTPGALGRGDAGTFPIVAFRVDGRATWGTEAVMLSAGTCIEWLRDDLGIIATAAESQTVAAQCATAGDVWFVPALLGLGTPVWDFGARGTIVGLTRGSGRGEIVRAVLEGVAHRGADLVEASERDSGYPIAALRVDGGMTDNDVFVQALADAIGRPVEISPVQEATTLGAGLLAGLAVGNYGTTDELAGTFSPRRTVEPQGSEADRVARASAGWPPGSRPRARSPSSRASPSEGVSTHPRRRSRHPSDPPSQRSTHSARYARARGLVRAEWPYFGFGRHGRALDRAPAQATSRGDLGRQTGWARASAQLLPACSSGRNPINCLGLPMAMTARRRSFRPKSATNFPSSGDPSTMRISSLPPRAAQHLQTDAVLIGPEVRAPARKPARQPGRPAS